MTYNNKKSINKFAVVFICFLIALSSMLAINPTWINKFYGETLCASSTAPAIDDTYFDYKDPNYLSKFDAYVDYVTFSNGNNGSGSVTFYLVKGSSIPTYSNMPTSFYSYSTNSFTGVTTLVSTTFSTTLQSSYGSTYINFTTTTTSYSATPITNFFVINNNSTYYTVCGSSLYSKHIAYIEGLADADTDTAYQNGYTAGQTDGYNSGYSAGNSAGITTGQNNVINNPNNYDLYTQQQYDAEYQRGYQIGQDDILVNPNSYGLYTQSQYDNNYQNGYNAGIVAGQNNVINNPNDYDLYDQSQYDNNYQDGYTDGQQSSTNYQDGYSAGQSDGINDVINNPNNYDLYTKQQYDAEYQRGYQDGLNLGKYGFTYNCTLYVRLTDQSEYIPITYEYVDNGIRLTQDAINYISDNFVVSNNYITFKLVATNEITTLYPTFNFFMNGVSQNTIDTFVGTARDIDGSVTSLVSMQYTYNSINRNGIVTGDNVADFNPASYRGGDWTGTVSSQYIHTDMYNVTLYNYDSTHKYATYNTLDFNFVYNANDLSKIYISDYNQSYIDGYEDGRTMINSNAYNEGYNVGYDKASTLNYDNAYNKGKSDGINSASNYSFYSLISSVVDAPLNMFKSLFNFNFLGINLFSFFTSLFTLALVVFIVTKLIKK